MNLVADTNVWYDVGAGRRNPATLKSGANRLIATPISFLEIASSIDERTFTERTEAAKAVLAHADQIANDSECHLRNIWGLSAPPSFPWIEGFKALAQAASVPQLKTGVDDLQERVRRTLNVPLAGAWRAYHWQDFADQVAVAVAVDQHCPGYKDARAQGRYIYLKHDERCLPRRACLAFRGSLSCHAFIRFSRLRTYLAPTPYCHGTPVGFPTPRAFQVPDGPVTSGGPESSISCLHRSTPTAEASEISIRRTCDRSCRA
jgi:hypothetical protein